MIRARDLITRLNDDVAEAKDNLTQAKVFQTHFANKNKVMLSTLHRQQEFKQKGDDRVAKFFPRYDSPYDIINTHVETSNYTLELPNSPNVYPTYHTSELKACVPNDPVLFPSCKHARPGPIMTDDGLEEFLV